VCCSIVIFGVKFSETVTVLVVKSVALKRTVGTVID
jgi:hypothetical protein